MQFMRVTEFSGIDQSQTYSVLNLSIPTKLFNFHPQAQYLFEIADAIESSKFNSFMLKHVPRAFQIIEEDEFQNFNPKS